MPLLTSPSNSQVWNILEFLNRREEKPRGQDGSGIPVTPLAMAEGRGRFSSHPRGSMTGKAGVGRAVSLKKRGAWAQVSFKPKCSVARCLTLWGKEYQVAPGPLIQGTDDTDAHGHCLGIVPRTVQLWCR